MEVSCYSICVVLSMSWQIGRGVKHDRCMCYSSQLCKYMVTIQFNGGHLIRDFLPLELGNLIRDFLALELSKCELEKVMDVVIRWITIHATVALFCKAFTYIFLLYIFPNWLGWVRWGPQGFSPSFNADFIFSFSYVHTFMLILAIYPQLSWMTHKKQSSNSLENLIVLC